MERLKGLLEHDPYRRVEEQRETALEYARLFARKSMAEGRRACPLEPNVRGVLHFVKSILLRAGFLDGALGWRVAWYGACEVALKWSFLRALQAKAPGHSGFSEGRHIPCNDSEMGGASR